MGIFIKTPRQPRRFSYEPRYYDPKRDEDLKNRMRIKSLSRAKRRSPLGIIMFLLLLMITIYLYNSVA